MRWCQDSTGDGAAGVRDQDFDFKRGERGTTLHAYGDIVLTDDYMLAKGR
jgi:hypothetical protein